MFRGSSILLACSISISSTLGCGGGDNNPTPTAVSTPTTPNPTGGSGATPTPTPSPSPTPTPTPTPTPGGQGANPGMYQVQLVTTHGLVPAGQVTVDAVSNNGATEVKLNQTTPNMQLFVKFCSFGTVNQNCVSVGSFTTDASGNADPTLMFPSKGTWAGVFFLGNSSTFDPSSQAMFQTEPAAFSGNFGTAQTYRVALQPQNNVTNGLNGIPTMPAPLTSGFVREVGNMLHAEVQGAKPNTMYDVGFCPNTIFGSGCNQFLNNTFTTDASGNGSVDMTETSAPAELFFVDVHNTRGQGYVTAFVVQ